MNDQIESNAPLQWHRTARVGAYESPRRARYPSMVRSGDGALLLMLTQQTAEQEDRHGGDLLLVRSVDEGETWSPAATVFAAGDGEPRAYGTMTLLQSGRVIAPLAKLQAAQTRSTVHMLSSTDHGSTWSAASPPVDCPLVWLVPTGPVIESPDGSLTMPVFGANTENDLQATIHNCGLLRSTDGGESWGDFTLITAGNGAVVGAADGSRFSFESPSVAVLADERWMAMVTARRLGEGPGAPAVLCRCYSRDRGRTWSSPDQIAIGQWPSLTIVDDQTTLCHYCDWSAWGGVVSLVSDDGFDSFHQHQHAMLWGWTQGYSRANVNEEVPSPPTVPYLGGEHWPGEHYGFPSAITLSEHRYAVALGRTCKGSVYVDPHLRDLPAEIERIEVVYFERQPRSAQRQRTAPARPHRWVLTERFNTVSLRIVIQTPDRNLLAITADDSFQTSTDGGRTWHALQGPTLTGIDGHPCILGITNAGRWLIITGSEISNGDTSRPVVGERGGYPLVVTVHGMRP